MPDFIPTKLQEERDKDKTLSFTIWLNEEEAEDFKKWMNFLEQPKPSSAMKTLAKIGILTLDDKKTRAIIETLFINKRRNKRTGLVEFEQV